MRISMVVVCKNDELGMVFLYGFMIWCIQALLVSLVLNL
jgi:hypothetical protein